MSKILFSLAMVAMFGMAGTAYAASNDYVPADGVCDYGDHAIWDFVAGKKIATSCIPAEDWNAVRNNSTGGDQSHLTTVLRGQSVMTIYGFVDVCPLWFSMNCVIEPEKVVRFL